MGKGPGGMTCADALRGVIGQGRIADAETIFRRVKKRYGDAWRERTIWLQMMKHTVNLVPARHQWEAGRQRIFFMHEDGRLEGYRPEAHGEHWA